MNKILHDLKVFESVVGQDSAKRKLGFYLDSYLTTQLMPNMIFVAAKGSGKTLLAKECAKGLVKFDANGAIEMNEAGTKPKRKTYIEINCSAIKNIKQFINSIVVPYVQDKDVTILFDEASELPDDVAKGMLTIFAPNLENKTSFAIDEFVCDFDFKRQTFIFATTEPQQIFHALLDRLKRIELEDYTPEQLATIVQRGSKDIAYADNVLEHVSSVLRGNARAATTMTQDILAYCKSKKTFSTKDWNKLRYVLGINPLGVAPVELHILRLLSKSVEGTSLTCLSAKTGMSRDSLQRDCEIYLQRLGLMEIATTGRKITAKGLQYLKELDGRTNLSDNKL